MLKSYINGYRWCVTGEYIIHYGIVFECMKLCWLEIFGRFWVSPRKRIIVNGHDIKGVDVKMSGGTKKQYKQYPINDIQVACQVLGSLIVGVIGNLNKYKEYSQEVQQLIDRTTESAIAKEYESINDKLLYRQHELLKYIADHQGASFSYIDIRALYEKKGI